MALDPLLRLVAQRVLAMPSAAGFALAGGGAMLEHGLVDRPTADIDIFAPDVARLPALVEELRATLTSDGFRMDLDRETDTFVRLTCHAPDGRAFEIDLALDPRLRPSVRLDVGQVIALEELAADKVLALFGRAQARDLVDVLALGRRFSPAALLTLAGEKDAGFDAAVFARAVRVAAARDDQQFFNLNLDPATLTDVRQRALAWADDLERRGD